MAYSIKYNCHIEFVLSLSVMLHNFIMINIYKIMEMKIFIIYPPILKILLNHVYLLIY